MLTHRPHQQIGLDAVEKGLDVEIKDPIATPASLPRHAHSIERRFAGPVSVGILVEVRFHEWFQVPFDHHLGDATVGIPSGRVLPSPFGMSTRRTGGGK